MLDPLLKAANGRTAPAGQTVLIHKSRLYPSRCVAIAALNFCTENASPHVPAGCGAAAQLDMFVLLDLYTGGIYLAQSRMLSFVVASYLQVKNN